MQLKVGFDESVPSISVKKANNSCKNGPIQMLCT